jgi:SEL1 protein
LDSTARNRTLAGIEALKRAAELGHPDAQLRWANALSAGFWPALHQPDSSSELQVQENWVDGGGDGDGGGSNEQQARALLLWHAAAMAGNAEAVATLASRVEVASPASTCERRLPYVAEAAHAVVDALSIDPHSRARVLPAADKHVLHRIHMHGSASSGKLDADNQPSESDETLQFYRMRAASSGGGSDREDSTAAAAAYTLARYYHYGIRGVQQNLTEAVRYYEQAGTAGHWEAAGMAGFLHLLGAVGGDGRQDVAAAHRLFRRGMPGGLEGCKNRYHQKLKRQQARHIKAGGGESGGAGDVFLCDDVSIMGMGLLRLWGIPAVLPVDRELALQHFTLARDQENVDASYYLAMMKLGYKTHFRALHELEEGGQTAAHHDHHHHHHWSAGGDTHVPAKLSHPTQQEYQSILTDLATAARKNHLQARHRLAMMYETGVKIPRGAGQVQVVPKDCSKAMQNYRWILDNASPYRNKRMRRAYRQYAAGDTAGALRNYLAVAETGHHLAQLNAAFLLERGECLGLDRLQCARAAVRLWKAASARGSAEASLRVGDFYYYGRFRDDPTQEGVVGPFGWVQYVVFPEKLWPIVQDAVKQVVRLFVMKEKEGAIVKEKSTEESGVEGTCATGEEAEGECLVKEKEEADHEHSLENDLAMAAYYYRLAAERNNSPRAHFNLGFLYEWGLGLKQDFPLAKRQYDLAVSSGQSGEADIAVAIALACLDLHEFLVKLYMSWERLSWKDYWRRIEKVAPSPRPTKEATMEEVPSRSDSDQAGRPVPGSTERRKTKMDVLVEHILSWESFLILLLTVVLTVLLEYRRTHR